MRPLDACPTALQAELRRASTGLAARLLGCCTQTLRAMEARGEIACTRTASGRRLWNVADALRRRAETQEPQS
jgi:DNA-binding transcriptional MerR regulator